MNKGHFLFTPKLVEDFKAYWLKNYQQDISDDQAEQYLNSLAELFLSFGNRQG